MHKLIFFAAPLLTALLSFCPLRVQTQTGSAFENLAELSLHDQPLPAPKPLITETDDMAAFIRQTVQVSWRPGDPIYLYVIRPKVSLKPPVVLYLNNYATDSNLFLDNDYCKLLTAQGVAAVGFASAWSGHRYHDRPMEQWFVSELPAALTQTVHDVQMVLNYLESRGDLDITRAGIEGDGSGGAIAILAAAVDSRIRVIDLLDPWGDWPDWLKETTTVPAEERGRYLTPEFLSQTKPVDPISWLPSLNIPIRLQYLRNNGAVPPESIRRMQSAAPGQTVWIPQQEGLAQYRLTRGQSFLNWIMDTVSQRNVVR